jgi:hypothetical protein
MLPDFVTRMKRPISARERRLSSFMLFLEDLFKVPVFRCQRCGECLLASTGFVCCQRCPKRMRNGPCGGTREKGRCEVFPERPCIWVLIHKRSKWMRRMPLLTPIKKIHNWELEKTSAWLNVFRGRIEPPLFFIPRSLGKKAVPHDPE